MKFRIVEIPELSGEACKIYTIVYDGGEDSMFERFQDRMDAEGFSAEVDEIWYWNTRPWGWRLQVSHYQSMAR